MTITECLEVMGSVLGCLLPELRKHSISIPHYILLRKLREEDYLHLTPVSTQQGCSSAAVTGTVDRLEGLGLLQRVHDKNDRRKIQVQITARGLRLLRDVDRVLAKHINQQALRGVLAFAEIQKGSWVEQEAPEDLIDAAL